MLRRFVFLLLPLAVLGAEPAAIPFPFDWSKTADSAIDLSAFLDAPAGRQGALVVKDGHLATPDGKRFRGWGVNLAVNICFADKDQAPAIAADLARWGVNVVRFHHTDTDWGRSLLDLGRDDTRHLDPENLDRFDYLFAELKKRGIYAVLTLNVHRKFKAGDGVRDWEILGIGKAATFFNPRLMELQHEFARNFLTHRNPYTGLEYRHEPAIATIEMVNENSLVEAWCSSRLRPGVTEKTDDTWQPIPDSYAEELTGLYNRWLEKNRTAEQITALRTEAGVSASALVPRLVPKEFTPASRERFQTEAEFIVSVETDFFNGYKKMLRDELGVKALLAGSNDHNDGISGYPHLRANLLFDVIDGHGYWEHPTIGKRTASKNNPMVNDPLDSTVTQYARTPVVGRPFTIGETNHAFPHRYAAEGYPILTAYGLFHGWDGIYWFDWEKGRLQEPSVGVQEFGWFDVSNDPVKLAQLATCALIWHRGDVAPARETHLRTYTHTDANESLRLFMEKPFFTPGFDLSTPLQHATRWSFRDSPALTPAVVASPLGAEKTPRHPWDPAPAEIRTDTGELIWSHADQKRGIVSIDTPHTCGLIGFIRAHWWKPGATTKHLLAEPDNEHCSILLTSLDGRPIGESAQLLLTGVSRSSNTGQTWEDDLQTLATWGQGPMQIVPVTGSITLKALSGSRAVRVIPLTAEGRPLPEAIPVEKSEAGWKIKLGTPPATWWLIEIER